MNYVLLVPKKLDSWSKNVISSQFSVNFRLNFRRKIFLGKFLSHQKIRLWISGVSLELFLSYRAYFHRYRYFRGFFETWIRFSKSCFILTKNDLISARYRQTSHVETYERPNNVVIREFILHYDIGPKQSLQIQSSFKLIKIFRKKWDFIGSFICSYGNHQLKRIWTRMII